MKRKLVMIGLFALLLAVMTACTDIPLRVSPQSQVLDIDDSEGGAWAYWQVDCSGDLVIDFGDGSELARRTIEGRGQISHLYAAAGKYTAKFYCGARSTPATVAVGVVAPVAYELWATQGYNVVERELMRFLVPYREHGCYQGIPVLDEDGYPIPGEWIVPPRSDPLFVSGVAPGTGATEFMLKVWNQDGERVSVFVSRLGPGEDSPYSWNGIPVVVENVWGEWIVLEEPINTSLQHVYVFGGWCKNDPPTAIWPDTMSLAASMGCDDTCDPWDAEPVVTERWMDFVLCARNAYADSPAAQWRVYISGGSC